MQEIQWYSMTLYEERALDYYEACSLDTIRNAVNLFTDWGVLTKAQASPENKGERMLVIAAEEDTLQTHENHVRKFLKNGYTNGANEVQRRTPPLSIAGPRL
eukprot:TRINITY_DN3494_c0_g1_i2.p1 TRINITY_DN3494_c0_g1~~TRINITY_DN3494_c0_g1_i2.p1  ORF type:complete len:102 (-),score=23.80 TRINITY_DN3494_c0_g1_i2:106-411(-)